MGDYFVHMVHILSYVSGYFRSRNCPTANQVAEGLAAVRPPPVRVQVVRSSTSLEHVIAADERPHEPIIVSRQQPVSHLLAFA